MFPKKIIKLMGVLAVLFSILLVFFYKKQIDYLTQNIHYEDQIDVKIKSKYNNRGTEILNDTIKLYGSYPIVNNDDLKNKIKRYDISSGRLWGKDDDNYNPELRDILPPYRLIKKANNDTLRIIKEPDTIIVVMKVKEREYDPKDSTYDELLKQLFRKK